MESDKWLVVVHVEVPRHWTLLEVRWLPKELRFYDSFSTASGYALIVKKQAMALLKICEEAFDCELELSKWRWIGEQVRV